MTILAISDKLARYISRGIYSNQDDIDIISYGLQGIISTLLNCLLALLISIKFGLLHEFILFNIVFIPIRINHKSYHCKTFISCLINSNIMIFIATKSLNQMKLELITTTILVLFFCYINHIISVEKNIKLSSLIVSIYLIFTLISIKVCYSFLITLVINCILIKWRKINEKFKV